MVKAKKRTHDSSKAIWVILALFVVILGGTLYKMPNVEKAKMLSPLTNQVIGFDFGNQLIMLDGEGLAFENGSYKSPDGQDTARITNSSVNSSKQHGAAIIVNNPGGSGTFYYVVGGSIIDNKEVYSAPVLIGDRVTIVSVDVTDDSIKVTYMDRSEGDTMASEAKKEVTKTFAFQEDGKLLEL